jgi:hypothetical protein
MNKKFAYARQFIFWLLGACIFIACVQFIVISIATNGATLKGLGVSPTSTLPVEETIELTVNTSQEILTTFQYSGHVTITIRGEGLVGANTYHDAFSRYTADQKLGRFDGFTVDGQGLTLRTFILVPTPTSYSEHEYRFLYWVGQQPRRIAFRIVNGNEDDDSVFTVEVTSQNLISPGGR